MNSTVQFFFEKDSKWQNEFQELRKIVHECGLDESLKWGKPCYLFNNQNIVLMHGFKNYCALLFFKGVLLVDEYNLLVQQTENVQAARQIRFSNLSEIINQKDIIKTYIFEAIQNEKEGKKVQLKTTNEFEMPEEFQQTLDNNLELKTAFEALSPGRQRAYLLFFSKAKQAKTRIKRIEKYIPHILDGKGIND